MYEGSGPQTGQASVDYRRSDAETVVAEQDSRPTCQAIGCDGTARTLLTIKWRGGELVQRICGDHEVPLSFLRRVVRGDVVVWETAL